MPTFSGRPRCGRGGSEGSTKPQRAVETQAPYSPIRLGDVFWPEHRLRVLNGKGRKQSWTGLGDQAMAAPDVYLGRFRGREPGPLFQTVDGRPLRNQHLNVIFSRHARQAGVVQVNPHRFRHTFATWAIRASARELDVQYLLGHTTAAMVRRYSATYDSEQATLHHAGFSPAAQLFMS